MGLLFGCSAGGSWCLLLLLIVGFSCVGVCYCAVGLMCLGFGVTCRFVAVFALQVAFNSVVLRLFLDFYGCVCMFTLDGYVWCCQWLRVCLCMVTFGVWIWCL